MLILCIYSKMIEANASIIFYREDIMGRRTKKCFGVIIVLFIILRIWLFPFFIKSVPSKFGCQLVSAESNEYYEDNESNDIVPLGLFTQITLSIGSSDKCVWAKAHNDFTLGTSIIAVYVELFSSITYQDDYKLMILESRVYIEDLDIGRSLETSVPIGGIQRYWLARMRYKFDNQEWVTKTTSTWLFDVDGVVVA